MARPNSADPEATRKRILNAAVGLTRTAGIADLSARPVAKAAGVSATTVCTPFDGMSALRVAVVEVAFQPLFMIFKFTDSADQASAFDIATAPLFALQLMPALVTQVAAYAGLRHGEHRAVAAQIDASWKRVRDHFALVEIPQRPLQTDDAYVVADRIIAIYFAAALHLTRDPDAERNDLRTISG